MRPALDLTAALADAAQQIEACPDPDSALAAIARLARTLLPGIDHVAVLVSRRGDSPVTWAATDDVAARLDQLQLDLDEGPGLTAMSADGTALLERIERVAATERWPTYVALAREWGLRSQLALRLGPDRGDVAVLNLYSTSSDVVAADTEQLAGSLATHAGLALVHVRERTNLRAALETRKLIGMALGMTMERYRLDEDGAFAFLTRVSATTERKLRDVAATIVAEHQPGDVRPGP